MASSTSTGLATAEAGGYAVSGVHIGDIVYSAADTARTFDYLEQVRRIAPRQLNGREWELAKVGDFCVADEKSSYLYWRGEAWAGKSALLSWFVLHPPEEVQIVSFFITARFAGQSDRIAFTQNVIEQLSRILGQSVAPLLSDATRDAYFLGLLTETARRCNLDGRRLVLIVDGLDEDRGVRGEADSYSIAGILPRDPPWGMRIIVAGRPYPPLPPDVDESHPLRQASNSRSLDVSRTARAVRADLERDLERLMKGKRPGRLLLGLLVASGGGLTGDDLAALSGLNLAEVNRYLSTVSGRNFSASSAPWRSVEGSELFTLAHEELQQAAMARMGAARIEKFRQLIHVWVDANRTEGWPADTPQYMLNGYFYMLRDSGDIARMIASCTDSIKHDRMLVDSGSDSEVIAQINELDHLLPVTTSIDDLQKLMRVWIHRLRVVARNASLPVALPSSLARMGQIAKATSLAAGITSPLARVRAQILLARILSPDDRDNAVTQLESARAEASGMLIAVDRDLAFADLAVSFVCVGLFSKAFDCLDEISGLAGQRRGFIGVALALAASGAEDDAQLLVTRGDSYLLSAQVLTALACAAIASGDLLQSAGYRCQILDSYQLQLAIGKCARIAVACGRADDAVGIADEIATVDARDEVLAAVVRDSVRFGESLDVASRLASSISDSQLKHRTLNAIVSNPMIEIRSAYEAAMSAPSHKDRAISLSVLGPLLGRFGEDEFSQSLSHLAFAECWRVEQEDGRVWVLWNLLEWISEDTHPNVSDVASSYASPSNIFELRVGLAKIAAICQGADAISAQLNEVEFMMAGKMHDLNVTDCMSTIADLHASAGLFDSANSYVDKALSRQRLRHDLRDKRDEALSRLSIEVESEDDGDVAESLLLAIRGFKRRALTAAVLLANAIARGEGRIVVSRKKAVSDAAAKLNRAELKVVEGALESCSNGDASPAFRMLHSRGGVPSVVDDHLSFEFALAITRGDLTGAELTARRMSNNDKRVDALCDVASVLARRGDLDSVLQLIHDSDEGSERTRVFATVSTYFPKQLHIDTIESAIRSAKDWADIVLLIVGCRIDRVLLRAAIQELRGLPELCAPTKPA